MTERRKIVVITHAGGSPRHGPNMRWYYLGQALRELRVDVEIVSSSWFHKYMHPPVIGRSPETEIIDGLHYHWIKTRPYRNRGAAQVLNQLEFTLGCYRAAALIVSRGPDVVVASSPHPLVVYPAVAVAAKAGSEFVFEVRDLWPELLIELGNFGRTHPYMLLLKAAERFGVRKASTIVSVKPGDVEYFEQEYGGVRDRFAYVPNGFLPMSPAGEPPPAVEQARRRYSFLIGYVGALSAYYGLDRLLELACRLRHRSGIGIVVAGQGDRKESLVAKAAELGLENVHFVGSIPRREVPAALDCFDACYVGLEDLAVHRYGVSCNKIYEYMHAARPVIGSYRAGHDPVRAAGCGFSAPPGDYDSLVKGIEALMETPQLAFEYGRRARAYFDEHHDFRIVAADLARRLFGGASGLNRKTREE